MIIKADMKFVEALVIASNFDHDKFTDEQRLKAIWMIKDAPTLNSVSKDKLQNALNWLFDYCFSPVTEPQTNFEKIQDMTIDEMADMLARRNFSCMPFCESCEKCNAKTFSYPSCVAGIKKWLESAAEEGDSNEYLL